ncbi:aldehyde dehydrogenase family protein, partial [Mycobacterium nebraskense]|uniref:aldehyde dehydrogenase family protein n=1 Tax=Mycobacterium nebraskense TaxID=244292 RepID=UPI001FC96F0F
WAGSEGGPGKRIGRNADTAPRSDPYTHGLEIAAGVRTGTYGINMYTLDIGAPFGGFKQSGIGREFGPEGLHEYVELQTLVCKGQLPPL